MTDRSLQNSSTFPPHQLSYVTNSGEGEGLVFYGSTIIPFKDKFDNSLMLYALMTSKPDEVEKRKKLGIGERDPIKEINETK